MLSRLAATWQVQASTCLPRHLCSLTHSGLDPPAGLGQSWRKHAHGWLS